MSQVGKQTPPTLIRYRGDEQMARRELDRTFEAELLTLLDTAGYKAPPFTVSVVTTKPGGKKGLHIGMPRPHQHGVEITWQARGNDSRIGMLLNAPHGVDIAAFHTALRSAVEAKAIKAEVEKRPDKASDGKSSTNVVAFKKSPPTADTAEFDVVDLGDFTEPEGELGGDTLPDAPAPPVDVLPKPPSAGAAFAEQAERVQEFVKLCLRYINAQGELKRTHCMNILAETCGIQQAMVKATFDSLIGAGHLRIVPNLINVRLGDQWRERYMKTSAAAAPASSAPAAPANPNPSTLQASIAALTQKVEAEATFRKRLLEITNTNLPELQKRREALDKQILKLEEERGQLTRERNSISQALENPEFSKARAELASIRKMIDGK